jgi:hypothetical protein
LDVTVGSTSGAKLFRFSGASGQSLYGYADAGGTGITRTDPYNSMIYFNTSNGIELYTASTQRVVLDSSGNLGLGVSPSAWGSAVKAYQVGNSSLVGTSTQMLLSQNYFFDGADKYIATGPVSQYYQVSGTHQWRIAPSGTAGDTISFTQAMTLTASGNLLVGTTSDQSRRVQVSGTLALVDSGLNSIADMSINSSGVLTISPYNGSGSTIVFGTAASGGGVTERARITSGGNLLVGTTTDEGGRGHFTSGSATNAGVVVTGAANTQGKVQFSSLNKNYYIGGGQDYLGMEYTVDGGQNHLWKIGTTERARITSGGGYFKASDDGAYGGSATGFHEFNQSAAGQGVLTLYGDNASTTAAGMLFIETARNTTDNTYYAISYYNTGAAAYKFRVADSGNVTNTNNSYGAISDAKMKTDIVDAGSQWADIKAVRFRKFKMKDDPQQITQLGVVAQELEQTSPGLVDEHADRDAEGNDLGTTTKSVKSSILLMKAAVALQEAMARIEKLEAEMALLKGA